MHEGNTPISIWHHLVTLVPTLTIGELACSIPNDAQAVGRRHFLKLMPHVACVGIVDDLGDRLGFAQCITHSGRWQFTCELQKAFLISGRMLSFVSSQNDLQPLCNTSVACKDTKRINLQLSFDIRASKHLFVHVYIYACRLQGSLSACQSVQSKRVGSVLRTRSINVTLSMLMWQL